MDEETTKIGEMWRIINKIEGYLDVDFYNPKLLSTCFWGEKKCRQLHVNNILNLQVGLTNLMFLPTSNTTAPQQELLIASKNVIEY
jgi:hypothetical protein